MLQNDKEPPANAKTEESTENEPETDKVSKTDDTNEDVNSNKENVKDAAPSLEENENKEEVTEQLEENGEDTKEGEKEDDVDDIDVGDKMEDVQDETTNGYSATNDLLNSEMEDAGDENMMDSESHGKQNERSEEGEAEEQQPFDNTVSDMDRIEESQVIIERKKKPKISKPLIDETSQGVSLDYLMGGGN